jgi:hypothetical protein
MYYKCFLYNSTFRYAEREFNSDQQTVFRSCKLFMKQKLSLYFCSGEVLQYEIDHFFGK